METHSDNNDNCPPPPEAAEVPQRKKTGRPPMDPHLLKSAQPDYFKNHYHEKRKVRIPCAVCSEMVTKNAYPQHKKSMKCRLVGLQNEQNQNQ